MASLVAREMAETVSPIMRAPLCGVVFETGACFIAGTLVHTKNGLVPIEKLKIGDMVLSKPENPDHGSELAYKRVMKTFVHEDKAVVQTVYKVDNEPDMCKAKYNDLVSTCDHPFWVEGEGWTSATGLAFDPFHARTKRLQLADGSHVDVSNGGVGICLTDQPGISWYASGGRDVAV